MGRAYRTGRRLIETEREREGEGEIEAGRNVVTEPRMGLSRGIGSKNDTRLSSAILEAATPHRNAPHLI